MLEDIGGSWQIPIKTKAGSCILWFSSLIHSAKHSEKEENIIESDPYFGYRCVYYITYRPKNEFTAKQLETDAPILPSKAGNQTAILAPYE